MNAPYKRPPSFDEAMTMAEDGLRLANTAHERMKVEVSDLESEVEDLRNRLVDAEMRFEGVEETREIESRTATEGLIRFLHAHGYVDQRLALHLDHSFDPVFYRGAAWDDCKSWRHLR